jgi:hypothetical protein
MWGFDVNRCSTCLDKDKCQDRKILLKAVSQAVNEANNNDDENSPSGSIIIACKTRISDRVIPEQEKKDK